MELSTPLKYTPGIGSYYAFKLKKIGLEIVWDLINHYPFRYDDFSRLSTTVEAQEGEKVTLTGEVWSIKNTYTRARKVLTQAIFNDGHAPLMLTWFNQPWLTKSIQTGDRLQVSGKLSKYKSKFSIVMPVWEKIDPLIHHSSASASRRMARTINYQPLHTGRLVPVYPETEGLSSKWLRSKVAEVFPQVKQQISDPLPVSIRGDMLTLEEALQKIHFPDDYKQAGQAQTRLAFDELFFIQLVAQRLKSKWQEKPTVKPFTVNQGKLQELLNSLPFKLTDAQEQVLAEVKADLIKNKPMNRLVQGEVGSGKTVVAAITAFIAYLNNLKTFYMAPTEILAFQHYSTFCHLLEPLGVKVGIYTGSRKFDKIKEKNYQSIPDVIIGTHALLSSKLMTADVGLVIIDEQQRFGVEQRSLLRSKAHVPHFLTMTATPIPRTVALTLYGDLDLSIINQLPKNRRKIKTYVVPQKKRQDAYAFIAKKVKEGDQVYIITPLIELSETLQSAKAATIEFDRLANKIFPDIKLGLLHGRLKSKEKEQVLNDFKDKKIDILVSTSVVEVGVDVTNATIMVIESAERFGLAQLHQLRGRVGRGAKQSYCLLFTEVEQANVINRLKNLEKINDGLKLAELDLKIRGGGEIFGTRQSGRFELKIASFADLPLVEKTRDAARRLLQEDPGLDKHLPLKRKLQGISGQVTPD